MSLPFTNRWSILKSRWIHFAAIPLFLLSLPCLSSASVLEGKIRETIDDVTHNPSITLHLLQRKSKVEKAHQAVALKCGLYGFVSKVHLGPLKNVNPRVNIKLRFDDTLTAVETWSWDPETAVAYNTSKDVFDRFFGKQRLYLELSAVPEFMNPIEGYFQLSTVSELIKEFQEKCNAIGWKTTMS